MLVEKASGSVLEKERKLTFWVRISASSLTTCDNKNRLFKWAKEICREFQFNSWKDEKRIVSDNTTNFFSSSAAPTIFVSFLIWENINANQKMKRKIKFWHVFSIYQSKSNVMLIFNVALAFENVETARFTPRKHVSFTFEWEIRLITSRCRVKEVINEQLQPPSVRCILE